MRCAASFAASVLVIFGFWVGGFNFDHRGEAAFFCYTLAITAWCAVFFYPGWKWNTAFRND